MKILKKIPRGILDLFSAWSIPAYHKGLRKKQTVLEGPKNVNVVCR